MLPFRKLLAVLLVVWLGFVLFLAASYLLLSASSSPSSASSSSSSASSPLSVMLNGPIAVHDLVHTQKQAVLTSPKTQFAYENYAVVPAAPAPADAGSDADSDADTSSSHAAHEPFPIPPEALALRREFGELRMCEMPRSWYTCDNNPTCVANASCVHPPHDAHFKRMHLAPLRFFAQQSQRHAMLQLVLDRMVSKVGANPKRRIVLMTLNSGFSFLFGNWYCSLLASGVDVARVKAETLVLARDEDALRYVTELGFFAPDLDEIDFILRWTGRWRTMVAKHAPHSFGQGSHSTINLLVKFGMPLDLLLLGYSAVAVQDVDFVWRRYPWDDVEAKCQAQDCNGVFISEGRAFAVPNSPYSPYVSNAAKPAMRAMLGPLLLLNLNRTDTPTGGFKMHRAWKQQLALEEVNTGMFFLPNKPSTVHFMKVLMQGIFLQQWKRRDQMYFNTVLYHENFAQLKWTVLPQREYVPGKLLHQRELAQSPLNFDKVRVMHVSDTGNYEAKIRRLHDLNEWRFMANSTLPQCARAVRACRPIKSCWASLNTCQHCQKD